MYITKEKERHINKMKNCEKCGKEIDDKYKYCMNCFEKYKGDNPKGSDEDRITKALEIIAKHIEHLNWNVGKLVSILGNDLETFNKIKDAENGQK